MTFVNGVALPELGAGAGFVLWSFRAIASGCGGCGVLHRGLERAFGADGGTVLDQMSRFARVLGNDGARRIMLASTGCCHVTADELSVVAVLSSAQRKNTEQCMAHIEWLMGGRNTTPAYKHACRIGDAFTSAGLTISKPSIELSFPTKRIGAPILNIVGNA